MTPPSKEPLQLAPPGGTNETTLPAPPAAATLESGRAPSNSARFNFTGLVLANDFQLVRRLGEGGMGQVFLAEQLSLKRKVAVKLLRSELAEDEISRKRFETEAKAVAQLNHANIVQVYAVGEQDGLLFMALEYVDGWTLRDYLARKGPPELPIALSIMRQVATALARAAEVGIIHRDIKPENILLTRKVEVKVTDFGLSRIINQGQGLSLTQTGTSMGTPLYMSPEQVMGVPLDPRTDLYSFGATSYHLLAGQPPFTGDSAMAVGIKHVQDEPTPLLKLRPDLHPQLAAVVHRLMAKRPEDRYQTAREVVRDLKRIADALLNGEAGAMGTGSQSSPLSGRHPPSSGAATEPYIVESLAQPGTAKRQWPSWLPWVVAVSLLIAVLAGAIAGQLLKGSEESLPSPTAPKEPHVSPTAPTEGEPRTEPPFPRRPFGGMRPGAGPMRPDAFEAERMRRIRETERVALGDDAGLEEGMRLRLELLFYFLQLPQRDLEKASRFVAELEKKSVPNYRLVGQMGEAIVLAHQRNHVAATSKLKELLDRLKENDPERRIVDQMLSLPDKNLPRMLVSMQRELVSQIPTFMAVAPPEIRELFVRANLMLPSEERFRTGPPRPPGPNRPGPSQPR